MRSLSPDEAKLWERVAATIRPLSRDGAGLQPADNPEEARTASAIAAPKARRSTSEAPAPPQTVQGTGNLDGSWDRRLKSGAVEPDRVIDLHGMSLDRAWRAIDRGLEEALARGERVVLLITGHHRPGEPPVHRGKIRAAVHDWLAASRHSASLAAVRGAHGRHGGGGSLYLVLRRKIPGR